MHEAHLQHFALGYIKSKITKGPTNYEEWRIISAGICISKYCESRNYSALSLFKHKNKNKHTFLHIQSGNLTIKNIYILFYILYGTIFP